MLTLYGFFTKCQRINFDVFTLKNAENRLKFNGKTSNLGNMNFI